MSVVGLTYGEYVEVGWAGKNHDQVILRAVTDDPESATGVQIAASYEGNRHNDIPALIKALQKIQDEDPTTPYLAEV
jgi:hypothetical protein